MSSPGSEKKVRVRRARLCPRIKEEKDPLQLLNSSFEVGAEFDSFDSLDYAIKRYEAENFVNLIIRDTRRIEAAEKRNKRKKYNPAIKYSDVYFCCTYGGKTFKSHSTGKRTHKSTKQACPFALKVRATTDGQRLFVREMCAAHNHDINEAEFRLHPKQRKLDHHSQEEIAALLGMEPDKKLLRDKLMEVTGKVILMKDIHNIKTRLVNPKIKPDCADVALDKTSERELQAADVCYHISNEVVEALEESSRRIQQQQGIQNVPPSHAHPGHGDLHVALPQILYQQIDSSAVLTDPLPNVDLQSLAADVGISPAVVHQPRDHSYLNSQSFHQPPSTLYSASEQTFPPQQVLYAVASPPFHQPLLPTTSTVAMTPVSSIIIHTCKNSSNNNSVQIQTDHNSHGDTNVRLSSESQHWTMEGPSASNITISDVKTTPTFPSSQVQPNPDQSTSPVHPQSRDVRRVQDPQAQTGSTPIIHDNEPLANQPQQPQQQQMQAQPRRYGNVKKCRKQLQQPKKRRKSPLEADKDNIKRKYFQQATVNLFFNERFQSNGTKGLQHSCGISTGGFGNLPSMEAVEYHEMLKPLAWLFGSWRSERGQGKYPTLDPFCYAEEAEFFPISGKPIVEYRFYSSKPDGGVPLHRETGFIRIKPGSNHIAFMAAHNLGVVEVQEGTVKDQELTVETTDLVRASFNKPPEVKKLRRTLTRSGDSMEQLVEMMTDQTAMTEHLRVTFQKVKT